VTNELHPSRKRTRSAFQLVPIRLRLWFLKNEYIGTLDDQNSTLWLPLYGYLRYPCLITLETWVACDLAYGARQDEDGAKTINSSGVSGHHEKTNELAALFEM
jgi:hypothetical protein